MKKMPETTRPRRTSTSASSGYSDRSRGGKTSCIFNANLWGEKKVGVSRRNDLGHHTVALLAQRLDKQSGKTHFFFFDFVSSEIPELLHLF